MGEATAAREPRYWKITVNPPECPNGAWEVCRSGGLAILGLPGEAGEASYAVRNLKQVQEGDWVIAYTPQEGSYTVGGVGRVARGYQCEEGPFEHPWNGPVRRSLQVEWHSGLCSIEDLVKDGRFRKGKIPRIFDEILPSEFECVRERVLAAEARPSLVETRLAEPEELPLPALDLSDAPLPSFFLEWAQSSSVPSSGELGRFDLGLDASGTRDEATPGESFTAVELMAAMERSREAQLLSSFSSPEAGERVLDFGLPTVGEVEPRDGCSAPAQPRPGLTVEPFAVRVGSLGWSGVFRREVESGRPCSLLLRGPQYSFLSMVTPDTALRGLRLFALFAIGAVAAPGKEAFRSGATFIFRGRRPTGDYEVEVRPRRSVPVFPEPAEVRF